MAKNNRTLILTEEDKIKLRPRLGKTTFCGDCKEIKWPEKVVDTLFLDPPYNLDRNFGDCKFKKKSHEQYSLYLNEIISHLKPILKDDASIFVCGDWKTSHSIYEVLNEHFIIQNRLTWQREKGRGAKMNWKSGCEDIFWATQGNFKFYVDRIKIRRKVIAPYKENGKAKDWNEDTGFRDTFPSNFLDIFSVPFWSMPENTPHPTQKPEKLLAMLILATTDEQDMVFDPFLGSGTTSTVAEKLNRNYLGCDIDENWCLFTEKRIELAKQNSTIQGFHDGIFWERNSLKYQQ